MKGDTRLGGGSRDDVKETCKERNWNAIARWSELAFWGWVYYYRELGLLRSVTCPAASSKPKAVNAWRAVFVTDVTFKDCLRSLYMYTRLLSMNLWIRG